MTEEQRTYEDVSDQFDFGSDELKEEGYKFWGKVVTAEIRRRPDETYERKDGSGAFTVKAHDEVNIWAVPTKGKAGEEPKARPIIQAPFTNNVNSKIGFFRAEAGKAGVTVKNIKQLEGRVFEFEVIEHKKFGNAESRPFCVIRAEDKGAAGVVNAATTSAPASIDWDALGAQVVDLLDGREATTGAIVGAVTSSDLRTNAQVIAAAAGGALLREAKARGLVEVVDGKVKRAA